MEGGRNEYDELGHIPRDVPKIMESLAGSTILVTGFTGFVGLALVEKLVRCVPGLMKIYVLIRPKRGKSTEDRFKDIMANKLFNTIRNSDAAAALAKVVPIEGSVDEEDLGLNAVDLDNVLSDVNFIFHCAATLDFEADLKSTMEINVMGTRNIIKICNRCTTLQCIVLVSSAYANANQQRGADEILYPPPGDVESLIEMIKTLPYSEIDKKTDSILRDHPNTYTFTKALAEHEVANNFKNVPSCIVRPSMIVGTWKDPVPGWTNSKNGPTGFFQGAANGVVRRLPVAKHLIYDYIPVDVVVNTMIAGAVYTSYHRNALSTAPIFQATSSTYNPFRWSMVEHRVNTLLQKYPLQQAVWFPYLKLTPSLTVYYISAFIFHFIPAYIFDSIAPFSGRRPRLVRLHTAIGQSLERLAPFIFREWMFTNKKTLQLNSALHPDDKALFNMDIGPTLLNWECFFEDMAKGVRRYLCNEEDTTLLQARRKLQWLKVFNILVQILLFVVLLFVVNLFGFSRSTSTLMIAAVIAAYVCL